MLQQPNPICIVKKSRLFSAMLILGLMLFMSYFKQSGGVGVIVLIL